LFLNGNNSCSLEGTTIVPYKEHRKERKIMGCEIVVT